ncbi:MAG TPA: chromate transporter [Candidatus Sulfotelmatobacter sp.]|nr:chromate transporter [Candidatus Sulfotelmatobacter sp.]
MFRTLLALAGYFAVLSLLAIGGGSTVVPDIHRYAVVVQGWLTDREFGDIYAIARTSPGPSTLFVSLVGLKAAGLPGALVATVAMGSPCSTVAFLVSRGRMLVGGRRWVLALERGIAPVALGLIAASAVVVTRAADHGAVAYLVTAATAAIAAFTRIHPLLVILAAGVLGALGLV